jgi:hypothetical protein
LIYYRFLFILAAMSQLRDTDVNVASNVDTDTDTDDESDPFDYPEVVKAIERCIELDSDFSVMQAAKIADEMLPDKDEEPKLRNGTSLLLAEHILTVAMKIPYDNPSQIKLALYVQCMMQSQKLGGYAAENTFDSGEVRCEEELTKHEATGEGFPMSSLYFDTSSLKSVQVTVQYD